jgi:pimeloyl-ACP methyl ester carboxylesterase
MDELLWHTILVVMALSLVWFVLELFFYILVRCSLMPLIEIQTVKAPEPHDPRDRLVFVTKTMDLLQNLKGYDPTQFMENAFRGAPVSEIRRENVLSFLAWAIYGSDMEGIDYGQTRELISIFDIYTERFKDKVEFKPGFNSNLKHVKLNRDTDVPYLFRPLIVYGILKASEVCANLFLLRPCGFTRGDMEGTTYWYHPGNKKTMDANEEVMPLVIFHGISSGWGIYMKFLSKCLGSQPIILVEMDGIKLNSLCFDGLKPKEYSDNVAKIIQKFGWTRCSVWGQSFGTITAGWLVKYHPELVAHMTLVDPAALLLTLMDVAYNFIYRKPRTFVEYMIRIVAARELAITYTLHRHFWPQDYVLWLDDVPKHISVTVAVSGHDEIVNGDLIKQYVEWEIENREGSFNCPIAQKKDDMTSGSTRASAQPAFSQDIVDLEEPEVSESTPTQYTEGRSSANALTSNKLTSNTLMRTSTNTSEGFMNNGSLGNGTAEPFTSPRGDYHISLKIVFNNQSERMNIDKVVTRTSIADDPLKYIVMLMSANMTEEMICESYRSVTLDNDMLARLVSVVPNPQGRHAKKRVHKKHGGGLRKPAFSASADMEGGSSGNMIGDLGYLKSSKRKKRRGPSDRESTASTETTSTESTLPEMFSSSGMSSNLSQPLSQSNSFTDGTPFNRSSPQTIPQGPTGPSESSFCEYGKIPKACANEVPCDITAPGSSAQSVPADTASSNATLDELRRHPKISSLIDAIEGLPNYKVASIYKDFDNGGTTRLHLTMSANVQQSMTSTQPCLHESFTSAANESTCSPASHHSCNTHDSQNSRKDHNNHVNANANDNDKMSVGLGDVNDKPPFASTESVAPVKILYWEHYSHAECLVHDKSVNEIIAEMRSQGALAPQPLC